MWNSSARSDDINNKAVVKINYMDKSEIELKAKTYKKNIITMIVIASIPIVFFCIMSMFLIFSLPDGDYAVVGLTIMMFIYLLFVFASLGGILHKSAKQLAFMQIKNELQKSRANSDDNVVDFGFNISRSFKIKSGISGGTNLIIDDKNRQFIYQNEDDCSKIYNFNDLKSYEVYENGKSQVQGTAGAALIGGAFFGLGGLIVGSNISRDVDQICNELKLIIRLNDLQNPQIFVKFISERPIDKSNSKYKKAMEDLQSTCSILEYILNNKSLEESAKEVQKAPAPVTGAKEQLAELKNMLDQGLISQQDYDQKKKANFRFINKSAVIRI